MLRAALQKADKVGIEELSMRKLARVLKVEAMSLYNHVANREDILDGLVELVVSEIEIPSLGGDWKATMRNRALGAHTILMQHPWATMLFVSRVNIGPTCSGTWTPRSDASAPRASRILWRPCVERHRRVHLWIHAPEAQLSVQPADYAPAATQFLHMIPVEQFPHLNGMSQEVIAGRHDGLHQLEFGLDLLLDGLERMRGSKR